MFTTLEFWVWVASALLIVAYGLAGAMKTFRSIPDLAKMMVWPGDVPQPMVRFVGIVEIAGALGLFLPVLTGMLPWLTPLAAIGLSLIQILAIGFHAQRGETQKTLIANLVLLALSLFVLWGRRALLGF